MEATATEVKTSLENFLTLQGMNLLLLRKQAVSQLC